MIYFLRHGESVANVRGVFAGQKDDTPLTDIGIQQAIDAGDELVTLKIDRIIASRLKRTKQTAIEVAKAIGFDPDRIEYDDRIVEYDMGAITGTPIRKVTSQELAASDGAEDPLKLRERVLDFLGEYKNDSQTILVVSHAAVGRAIEAAKLGMDPAEFYDLSPYPNAHALQLYLDWL